jgi:subtilisin family serine protease
VEDAVTGRHITRYRLVAAVLCTAATTAFATLGGPASVAAVPAEGTIVDADSPHAVAGSYIVALRPTASGKVAGKAGDLATRYGGTVQHTYTAALQGFSTTMSLRQARRLAADPDVAYVQQNKTVHLVATQLNPPSWGLDRIDQRNLPLDNSYTYSTVASNVHAYIIDTGIRRTHTDLGGRAVSGVDEVTPGGTADDCNGHGTHVAGTVGGSAYGVAKGVSLVAVRVLDCSGSGTTAGVAAGVDWVTANAIKPAVANMSLGGGPDVTLDSAVQRSIASGVTYGIAAGNSNANACDFSPARVPEAITVGATDISDNRASFSNFGTCLDIFAPGVNITSAWNTTDTATNTISGTSMATPHVVGAAALILAANPTWTPQQVRDSMVASATPNKVIGPGAGSPNLLLFTGSTTPPPPPPANDFSIAVSPTSGSVTAGTSVVATVTTTLTTGAAQTINLSAAGQPSGATVTFNPASVTSGGSSTMTIATTTATPAGTYLITITGTGTGATHSTTFTLTVAAAGGCGDSCDG